MPLVFVSWWTSAFASDSTTKAQRHEEEQRSLNSTVIWLLLVLPATASLINARMGYIIGYVIMAVMTNMTKPSGGKPKWDC